MEGNTEESVPTNSEELSEVIYYIESDLSDNNQLLVSEVETECQTIAKPCSQQTPTGRVMTIETRPISMFDNIKNNRTNPNDEQSLPPKKLMKNIHRGMNQTAGISEAKEISKESTSSESKKYEKNNVKTTLRGTVTKATGSQDKFTPKAAKGNKSPNFPIPTDINQYGNCLKTKVGMHYYGLTLMEPPSQFFRGVLKGTSGQTLAVMFGDTDLFSKLDMLPQDSIGRFAIDTTFRAIPDTTAGIHNVLSILMLFKNQVIPVWYAVTSRSSTEIYKRILIEFQQYVLDWQFKSILLNNDPDLIKAVNVVFPKVEIYGSWFHYCYTVWREVRFNNLVEECKLNEMMMKAVKMLMAIPFLPPPDEPSQVNDPDLTMLQGFHTIEKFAQEHNFYDNFKCVLDFVDLFWFQRVECQNFSLYKNKIEVQNHIELFQVSLLSYLKPEPDIWNLTDSFRNADKDVCIDIMRFLSGKNFLYKKAPKRKIICVPIHQNLNQLLKKKYDLETFLNYSIMYCDDILDVLLHPLYPTTASEKEFTDHCDGWSIK